MLQKLWLYLGQLFIAWGTPVLPVDYNRVESVVRLAYERCGLPKEQFSIDFDLVAAGKLADVLVVSASTLDHDLQFRTVGDVINALVKE